MVYMTGRSYTDSRDGREKVRNGRNLRVRIDDCKELKGTETGDPKSQSSLRMLLVVKSNQKNPLWIKISH
jgi:hypothetical protein